MNIYTHTGDDGNTSLSGGERIPKHHPRVDAYGTIDELICWIGLLKDYKENDGRKEKLVYIQNQLMRCSLTLATKNENDKLPEYLPESDCITIIENEIDRMETKLPQLKNFLLPGGNILVSHCHIARCVCRRAERTVINLSREETVPVIVSRFLNRLSDYLFVLARTISLELDIQEVVWRI